VTLRLASLTVMAALAGLPLSVWPATVPAGLAALALAVGGAGALTPSVPLATAGAALALIEYALALGVARPPSDPVTGTAVGAGCVLLLAIVHFTARTRGAVLGARVVRSQARHWLAIVALGTVGATLLTLGGLALGLALRGATLPVLLAAAAAGALVASAGVLGLVARAREA
jgi:hypothetical protein